MRRAVLLLALTLGFSGAALPAEDAEALPRDSAEAARRAPRKAPAGLRVSPAPPS